MPPGCSFGGDRGVGVTNPMRASSLNAWALALSLATWAAAAHAAAPGPAAASAASAPSAAKKAPPAASPAPLVDINSASRAQLKTLPGIGDVEANRIIAGRPYHSKADLAER